MSSGQNVSAVPAFCSIAFFGRMPLQAQLVCLHQSTPAPAHHPYLHALQTRPNDERIPKHPWASVHMQHIALLNVKTSAGIVRKSARTSQTLFSSTLSILRSALGSRHETK